MKTMFLVRGLPGAGKTTLVERLGLAEWLVANDRIFAADDHFMVDGEYVFDPAQLPKAHANCLQRTRVALENGGGNVFVHNTFTCRWEMEPYLRAAEELGVEVAVVDLFDAGCSDERLAERSSHGVPVASITGMRERYEHDWKDGDPRPPWEREG